MKPTALAHVQTIGSLGDDTTAIKMGVDESNIEHLLMLLTDLYSDPIMAVVREYSTNARDSHKEAGNDRPIEVTLPNALNPFFKVRDYGVGLSKDEVERVYSKYGSSTKRNSDDFNGMLGLGCKSALTYTNQFTVVSVKDGVKITVVVQRAGSSATMQVMSEVPVANTPNGVEISVPVRGDSHLFEQKAKFLFSFWEPGTVLLNGVTPERVQIKEVTKNIGMSKGLGSDIVVMGGVPYPVDNRLYNGQRPWNNSFNIVAFVNIGEVAFTPSREALMYTKHTEATIDRLVREFAQQIGKTIVDDIESAATHAEAYRKMVDWSGKFGPLMPRPVMYKGEAIPSVMKFKFAKWDINAYRHAFSSGYDQIGIDRLVNSVVIYDYNGVSLTSTHKAKIKQWRQAQGLVTTSYFVLTENKEGAPWVSPERMVSWNDIKKIVLPGKDGKPAGTRKPTIQVHDRVTGYEVALTDLDKTKTPVYISPTARLSGSMAVLLYKAFPDIQIVSIGENRWEKFKRENKGALPLREYIKANLNTVRDALTADDLRALGMDIYVKRVLASLDHTKIEDPDLAAEVKFASGDHKSATLEAYQAAVNICYRFSIFVPDVPVVKSSTNKYPLIQQVAKGSKAEKHMYLYINAAYIDSL